jgi:hypothetical protein
MTATILQFPTMAPRAPAWTTEEQAVLALLWEHFRKHPVIVARDDWTDGEGDLNVSFVDRSGLAVYSVLKSRDKYVASTIDSTGGDGELYTLYCGRSVRDLAMAMGVALSEIATG